MFLQLTINMLLLACLSLILALYVDNINCEFSVPEIQFVAYDPVGFRVSIPADDGIQLFAFHGNLNKRITQIEPGEFSEDVSRPENSLYTYTNQNLKLNVGDKINYWVFVQHQYLGYRKFGELEVTRLIKPSEAQCNTAQTLVGGVSTNCVDQVIFQDEFGSSEIDRNKWTVEQYIPNVEVYEFVYYQPKICVVENNRLIIRPIVLPEEESKRSLDLKNGCTRTAVAECFQKNSNPIPPVKSGKLTSKFKFTYGSIEIKAKFPKGDWIYPELYLEMGNQEKSRIYIAFARGNEALHLNGENIGGSRLYGGPSQQNKEKFKKMINTVGNEPFSNNMHVYKLIWKPNSIELFVDGAQYGNIPADSNLQNNAKLVIGVSAAGFLDFPGNTVETKPWLEDDRLARLQFYENRTQWQPTWTDPSLQIEYVKIRAV